MECNSLLEYGIRYKDGDLNPRKEIDLLNHLDKCRSCRLRYARIEGDLDTIEISLCYKKRFADIIPKDLVRLIHQN